MSTVLESAAAPAVATPGDGTLPGLLCTQAQLRPTAVALRQKDLGVWQETTWAGFLDHVRAVTLALDELGIGPGDRVGIIADNEPAWLFADLGIQATGAMSVAAYPTQVADEVAYIMSHSEVKVIFCGDQEQVDKILETRDRLPTVLRLIVFDMRGVEEYGEEIVQSYAEFETRGSELHRRQPSRFDELLSARSSDDIAFVGYTSGTTGKPKGALLRHRNQVTMARVMAAWARLSPKDRDFCHFPLCHPAVRVTDAYTALVAGSSVNFPESPDTVARNVVEIAPTFMQGTPRVYELMKADVEIRAERAAWMKRKTFRWGAAALQRVLDRKLAGRRRFSDPALRFVAHWLVGRWIVDRLGLLRLRRATCGGASVSPELLKFYWSLGVPVYETYGQSEASGVAFSQRDYRDLGSTGWPLEGVEAVVNEDAELLLRGDGIFAGYLNDAEKTEAAFAEGGWYRTGDVARFDEEGRLVILDREKHVIHTGDGRDVSPSEIENKLKLSPYVCDAMVVGGGGGATIGALIQLEYETVADWAQGRNLLYTTYRSLSENPSVVDLIESEVAKSNRLLPEGKQVRDFRLLPRELDPDDDEVTPTRKIKREVVARRFAGLIESMSPGRETVEVGSTNGR
ncbi:MAG: AMP-dependent synthetase/ligase [Acidimicrobiales bacterium]